MKRTLTALAVLGAFAGAASAQSSVTIYGLVDAGVSKSNAGKSVGFNDGVASATNDMWVLQNGQASRLGFRGKEDLGGGMYARFDIQHRLLLDTGAAQGGADTFWRARSIVALGGGFGEVYLGREYVPAFWVALAADPTGWNYVSQIAGNFTYAGYDGSSGLDGSGGGQRRSNTVGYKTPNLGGFTAEAAVAAGEGSGRKRTIGFNAQYSAGPIYAGVAYDGNDGDNRLWVVTGGFDFGVIRPVMSYSNAKGGKKGLDYSGKDFSLSASAPLGNGRLYFGGARIKYDYAGLAKDGKATKLFAGYEYSLSKRTTLYTNVGSVKATDLSRSTAFDLGIDHSF